MLHTGDENKINSAGFAEEESAKGGAGVMSGDDLFAAYNEGKSIEELNSMLEGETPHDEGTGGDDAAGSGEATPEGMPEETGEGHSEEAIPETPAEATPATQKQQPPAEGKEGAAEPYRVFQTREDFQRQFDHEWGKRHKEMKEREEAHERQMDHVRTMLSGILNVPKEQALEELAKRRYSMEAEEKGIENPEQYVLLKKTQDENEQLRKESAERLAQQEREQNARLAVENIRRQGEALAAKLTGFNLDAAMENQDFRQMVFTLNQAGFSDAVERAHRAVFFDAYNREPEQKPAPPAAPPKLQQTRPREGGAAHGAGGQVREMDFSHMSSQDILALEKRILSGEKIM